MKTKKLLLALPMVAILASCSGRIEVYRDIFKDARDLSVDQREEIISGYEENRQYHYSGTRTIVTYMDNEEVGRSENSVLVEFNNDPSYEMYGFTYSLDMATKYSAHYDTEAQQWNGTTPEGITPDNLYHKFQNLIYSWNGHVLVGNFDVAPYDFNTKLLNCVSAKFTKREVDQKNVAGGNFSFSLREAASYSDGEIVHKVNSFNVTYVEHRITYFGCEYQILINDAGVRIDLAYSGEFNYNYIH